MTNKVFVYIDHFDGQALPASWEAIGVARSMADTLGGGVTAVVLGHDVEEIVKQAIEYGADEVQFGDDPELKDFRPEPYAGLLSELAGKVEVLLFPTTSRTRELAGLVAVDLETGVAPDVIAFEIDEGVA